MVTSSLERSKYSGLLRTDGFRRSLLETRKVERATKRAGLELAGRARVDEWPVARVTANQLRTDRFMRAAFATQPSGGMKVGVPPAQSTGVLPAALSLSALLSLE